ncbi:MAG: PIN domain-containing protein [Pseudothermotoga sp.]
MFLIDTNIWLERLLDQERANEVKDFLEQTPSEKLYMSDFTFHSIGIILGKLKKIDIFVLLIQDAFVNGAVSLVRVELQDMKRLVEVMDQYRLDFDDAYQYVVAETHRLTIISFDSDFDRTSLGRKTPLEVLGVK